MSTCQETQLLHQMLARYGLAHAETVLLQSLNNQVYRVEDDSGRRFSLRICPAHIQSRQPLEDELAWLNFLAGAGQVHAPQPVRNQQGDWLTAVATAEGERLGCLFAWVEGVEASRRLAEPVLYAIGRVVASLHQAAKQFSFPAADNTFRGDYRYDRTLTVSHRDWIALHQAEIGPENTHLLYRAVDWVTAAMDRIGTTPENYGFIHADLHLGNFLVHGDRVSVIDFDQLGRGHFLYDLAGLAVELLNEPSSFPVLWESFKAGYREVAELPFGDEQELDPFIVAVNLGFLDWVYNAPNPQVRQEKMVWVPATYASIRRRLPPTQG
jgi:Ser/Thr protein kinase RdoA (MazF antagonist)